MSGHLPMKDSTHSRVRTESDTHEVVIDGVPHKFVYLGLPSTEEAAARLNLDARYAALQAAEKTLIFAPPEDGVDRIDQVIEGAQKYLDFLEGRS